MKLKILMVVVFLLGSPAPFAHAEYTSMNAATSMYLNLSEKDVNAAYAPSAMFITALTCKTSLLATGTNVSSCSFTTSSGQPQTLSPKFSGMLVDSLWRMSNLDRSHFYPDSVGPTVAVSYASLSCSVGTEFSDAACVGTH